ncbi:MAG: peptide deformylase [Rikenellaceae bacterium]
MIYPIHVLGSSVLREPTKELTSDYPEFKKLIDDMFETMYYTDGVGLAAPQIGKALRLFVIDASAGADEDPSLEGYKKVFVNPEIYEESEQTSHFTEGCLSVPGIHEDVVRPVKIKVSYLDENFEPHDEEFDGYPARIIQHEYDHLEEMLFVDRLSPIRKTLLKSKLNAMAKGKYKVHYKTK